MYSGSRLDRKNCSGANVPVSILNGCRLLKGVAMPILCEIAKAAPPVFSIWVNMISRRCEFLSYSIVQKNRTLRPGFPNQGQKVRCGSSLKMFDISWLFSGLHHLVITPANRRIRESYNIDILESFSVNHV